MRKLLTVALLAFAAACSDSTAPDNSFVGTYPLRSIDGVATPVEIFADGEDFARVTGGSLIFDGNGTFTISLDVTYGFAGTIESESQWSGGTFRRSGREFTLTDAENETYVAIWDGSSTMTTDTDGVVFVFRR